MHTTASPEYPASEIVTDIRCVFSAHTGKYRVIVSPQNKRNGQRPDARVYSSVSPARMHQLTGAAWRETSRATLHTIAHRDEINYRVYRPGRRINHVQRIVMDFYIHKLEKGEVPTVSIKAYHVDGTVHHWVRPLDCFDGSFADRATKCMNATVVRTENGYMATYSR